MCENCRRRWGSVVCSLQECALQNDRACQVSGEPLLVDVRTGRLCCCQRLLEAEDVLMLALAYPLQLCQARLSTRNRAVRNCLVGLEEMFCC